MQRSFPAVIGTALVLLAGFVVADSSGSPPTLGDRLVAESRKAVASVRTTKYDHRTQIDEAKGSYVTDCSGFVCWVMQRTAPDQLAAMDIFKRKVHPLAEDFYASIHESTGERGWVEITHVAHALPGDILAYRYTQKGRRNTGHVVVINGKPSLESTNLWRVPIIDATGKPHANDTRPEGTSGLGAGTLWLLTHDDGRPRGVLVKSPADKPNVLPINIGRLVPIDLARVAGLEVKPATTRPWLTTQPAPAKETAAR